MERDLKTPESAHPAQWWHPLGNENDARIQCDLCPRDCQLREGQRGLCFVRQNLGGKMVLSTYGRSTGFCIDPIEKKPLNHFYPGSAILSFGTAGCNLACKFCQNWDMTRSRDLDRQMDAASPEG
ncbi:MAG: AmmeMemoRadiSam system radical SAM enzyme, partial [Propionivibrio sp.]|nr:AmmeMemoRadiSam system radical SAM enzyme [Propionivibrio sp.]